MRIAVLGAGVIGVTTAYYLAKAGTEVVVIDRQPGVALETSFANAGEVSPGYASPWASPGLPTKAAKWLFMKHSPLILRPRPDPDMLRWMIQLIQNWILTSMQMGLLGAILTFATRPFYYWHLLSLTERWGLTPLQDQQLGGVFMCVPGVGLFLWAAIRSLGKLWRALEGEVNAT